MNDLDVRRYIDIKLAFSSESTKSRIVRSIQDLNIFLVNPIVREYLRCFTDSDFGQCVEIEKHNMELVMNFKYAVLNVVNLSQLLANRHRLEYSELIKLLYAIQPSIATSTGMPTTNKVVL